MFHGLVTPAGPPSSPRLSHIPNSPPNSPLWLTTAQKGKGRQRSPEEHHPVHNSASEVKEDVGPTEEAPNTSQKKCGPMPKVAWQKARDLTRELLTAANQLTEEFGRSRQDILIAARLGVTASHRKRNDANTYRSWYWNTQEIPSDKVQSEINKLIDDSYKELFKGIGEKDVETREQLMAPYNQWLDKCEEGDQMASMAESWSNLEDIEVVGAVMYVGNDPASAQTSGVFGGSENIRGYINDNHVNLRQMLSKYTMVFHYCRLQGEGNTAGMDINFTPQIDDTSTPSNSFLPHRASLLLHCQHKEIARDCNRRVLGVMFREKLTQVFREIYGNGGEYPDPQKVPASSWLSAAYKHTMFIGRWPLDTKFPGPDFSFKELKNRELRIIKEKKKNERNLRFFLGRRWSDLDKRKRTIPLVASSDGFSLQELGDFEEWKKVYQLAVEEKDVADASRLLPFFFILLHALLPTPPLPLPAPTVACPPSRTTNTVAAPSVVPGPAATERHDLGRPEGHPSHLQYQVPRSQPQRLPSRSQPQRLPSRSQPTRLPIGLQPRLPSGSRPRPHVQQRMDHIRGQGLGEQS
ncbi:hypothetical protein K503DRAFT_804238 [Rhizopogon vinicolor AM-OR11-026]|uniref:Uncharacterized protein n=1 Tax=Rhizopogon vinicolor AM-OR11-026 TaxID=1314800 RepID=A0A1B7MLY2_9AGAM|nr:hypothetical protein K503DRAFT_804238 [Rhizopogon vinicolor AM-OR11-026]